jgi:hypothetical protein
MKNIAYLSIMISLLITPLSALEKKDCSGLKKLSKAFIACKSGNLKVGIVNTGSKIKKNTVGKIKIPKKDSTNEENIANVKKKNTGMTKQYPKGTK